MSTYLPTIKQLQYLVALHEHGHFGRAADSCFVSQSTLSAGLRELESLLGVTLVERSRRVVRFTALGEQVVAKAHRLLREAEELSDLVQASGKPLTGTVRMSVIPTIAPYLLPGLIGALRKSHPSLELEVRETMTERLIEELSDGKIDTAIVALPVDIPNMAELPLFSESLMLVRPSVDADEPVPSPDNLGMMRLLMLEQGHCFRDQALAFCNLHSAARREGLDGSSLSTLVQMVGAGIGVTLIPEMAVGVETRSAPVSVGRFPAPEPQRTVGLIWRKTNPMADQFAALGDKIKDVATTLSPAP